MSEILIQCQDLHKRYGRKEALCGVNLRLESGKIVGLLGPNGSGKTTLLEETIRRLKAKRSIYVIEGDQQTSNDADRIAALEIPVFQVNTGTGCHLEADMVNHAVKHLNPRERSFL